MIVVILAIGWLSIKGYTNLEILSYCQSFAYYNLGGFTGE
jgi:hypothetical protein